MLGCDGFDCVIVINMNIVIISLVVVVPPRVINVGDKKETFLCFQRGQVQKGKIQ